MARKRIYTDEERKERKKESNRKWKENNPEKVKENQRKWNEANPEYMKEWREENPDYDKQRYQENPDKAKEKVRKYQSTPMGRANYLVNNYRRNDKIHNRGECTITGEWIVDNIFTKPCAHCGIEGWNIIGCNRIDNNLPHTPDNVEPCCLKCNLILEDNKRDEFGRFKKNRS